MAAIGSTVSADLGEPNAYVWFTPVSQSSLVLNFFPADNDEYRRGPFRSLARSSSCMSLPLLI